jgi:hypothetical protein
LHFPTHPDSLPTERDPATLELRTRNVLHVPAEPATPDRRRPVQRFLRRENHQHQQSQVLPNTGIQFLRQTVHQGQFTGKYFEYCAQER